MLIPVPPIPTEPGGSAATCCALWQQLLRGHYAECLTDSAALLKLHPDDPHLRCIQAEAQRLAAVEDLGGCFFGGSTTLLGLDDLRAIDPLVLAQALDPKAEAGAELFDPARGPFAACVADATAAIARRPDDPYAHLVRAVAHRFMGDLEAAVADLDRALLLQPTEAFALQERARCRFAAGDFAACVGDCDAAVDCDPEVDNALYVLRAKAHLRLGDPELCIKDCTTALERQPDLIPALLTRAEAQLQVRHWEGALEDCVALLNQQPNNAQALQLRAQAALPLKAYKECVEDCNIALKLGVEEGDLAVVYGTRAEARRRRGHLHDAIEDCLLAQRYDPDLVYPALTLTAVYLANHHVPQALAECTKALQRHPHNPELLMYRAKCHLELRQALQCIRDCTDVISAHKAGALAEGWLSPVECLGQAYAMRAEAFLAQGNTAKCLEDCRKALACTPELGVAFLSRAVARRREGDPHGCVADCDRAIEADPGDPAAYRLRAETLAQLGEYQRCIDDCNEAIDLAPGDGAAYALRGAARRLLQDYEGCVRDCSEAIMRDAESAMAFANRAAAHRRLGDYRSALADATQALQLEPSYRFARLELQKLRHPVGCGCFPLLARRLRKSLRKSKYSKF